MSAAPEVSFYKEKLNIKEIINKEQLACVDEALNICDLTSIVEKYRTWQRLMPRITPYYAVKCNDDALVVKTIAKLGASFDCASLNEIKQVLDLGVSPNRIIFANPCKPVSHLQYAKDKMVHTVTVDNEFEIYKIFEHYPESNLVIRFRSEAKEAQCPLGDKFGCDPETDATALIMLAKSLNLNVIGTCFHVGSGCNDFPAYHRAITTARNLFNVGKLLGYDMNLLDIGGGFPGYDDVKFETIAEIVNKSLSTNFKNDDVRIIAEPGRFFVAAAYTLICKIHAKREVRTPGGKLETLVYYLNDGVYGCFNCILFDHQVVTAEHYLDNANDLPKFKTVLFGPTCDALDKISDETYLPNMKNGDFIGFPNMGAYTIPIASPFNGFMLPKTRYFMNVDTII